MILSHFFISSVCGVLLAASLPCSILRAEEKNGWKITEIGGEKYVAVEHIKKFYRFEKMNRNQLAVRLENGRVFMDLEIGSPECRINRIKFILSKPVVESGNATYISSADLAGLLDPILRPNHIKGAGDFKTVILDPARGVKDPGITNELGAEGEFSFKIAELAKAQLKAKGFTVVLTRDEEQDASPEERSIIANAVGETAIFISISFNSSPLGVNGIQTFPVARGKGVSESDPFGLANVALSTGVHASMIVRLDKNTSDGGIKWGEPDVFSQIRHPAIIVKAGYMTHPVDSRLIDNETYQSAIAGGIVDGVLRYRYAVTREAARRIEPEE